MDTLSIVVLVVGAALIAAVVATIVTKSLSAGARDANQTPVMLLGTALGVFRWLSGPMDISSTSLNGKVVGYSVWSWNGNNWILQKTVSKNLSGFQEPIEPPTYPNIPVHYTVRVIYKPTNSQAAATKTPEPPVAKA
jgi:hypothetical protein